MALLDKDLSARQLYLIARDQPFTDELANEIMAHRAADEAMRAWVAYRQASGMDVPPPQPATDTITDEPAVEWEVFGGEPAPQPVKKGRSWLIPILVCLVVVIAGGVGAAWWLVSSRAPDTHSTPASSQTKAMSGTERHPIDMLDGLRVSGSGFVCHASGREVECFGQNTMGQLGAGVDSPEHVGSVTFDQPVKYLSAGADFACASSGVGVTCWGDNRWKQAGDNGASILPPTPIPAFEGKTIDSLSAGEIHVLVVSEGKLYAFGSNYAGQFGSGEQGDKAQAVTQIPMGDHGAPLSVEATRFGGCVATDREQVVCFGSNENRRVNSSEDLFAPLTLMTPSDTDGQ